MSNTGIEVGVEDPDPNPDLDPDPQKTKKEGSSSEELYVLSGGLPEASPGT